MPAVHDFGLFKLSSNSARSLHNRSTARVRKYQFHQRQRGATDQATHSLVPKAQLRPQYAGFVGAYCPANKDFYETWNIGLSVGLHDFRLGSS